MLLEQRIKKLKHISSSEQMIADYILKNRYSIQNMSTRDIAKNTYTSSATIVRFAQKLGYKGFNDLRKDYINELHYIDTHFTNVDANYPFLKEDSLNEIAGKINILLKETLDDSLSLIDFQQLENVIQILQKSENIHIFAIGSSLLFAQRFKHKMGRIGKKIEIETLVGEYGFNVSLVDSNDCAILISYSGETTTVLNNAKLLNHKNIPIIAITSLGDNKLTEYADITLHITTREKQYSKISSFSSEYSIQFILDILYSGYFALKYEENLNKKVLLSKTIEKCRNPQSDIIKEKNSND